MHSLPSISTEWGPEKAVHAVKTNKIRNENKTPFLIFVPLYLITAIYLIFQPFAAI
jgi:hypothetical protein